MQALKLLKYRCAATKTPGGSARGTELLAELGSPFTVMSGAPLLDPGTPDLAALAAFQADRGPAHGLHHLYDHLTAGFAQDAPCTPVF